MKELVLKLRRDKIPGWVGLQLLELLLQLGLQLHQLIILLHRDKKVGRRCRLHLYT